ncbi:MAG TPA: LysE family translocator [Steroidobacteraceae bacterium]|nr:LysE family translocator [Steroidobacteraceae bacterium]
MHLLDTAQLLLFLTATLALNLAPGPDVLYVLANSARHGVRGAVFAALGISGGIVFHTCIAAFGIAALLLAHRWAFDGLRIAGALYLIWLGISAWRSAVAVALPGATDASLSTIFRKGLITNVLNPKVALFFMAFLPQFADPAHGSVTMQVLIFGALFIVSGTIVNLLYAWAGGALSAVLRRDMRWQRRLNRISGGILVVLGGRLLLSPRLS